VTRFLVFIAFGGKELLENAAAIRPDWNVVDFWINAASAITLFISACCIVQS